MERRIRLIIADDHSVVRTALARVLDDQEDLDVVGEAANGREAIRLTEELEPDVVVMDVGMGPVSGTEATRTITALRPSVKIVGLSMHESAWMGRAMLQAGARAFVEKAAPLAKLIAEIRNAAEEQPSPGSASMIR